MNRRSFMAAILGSAMAPAIVRACNLMSVRVLDSGVVAIDWGFGVNDWTVETWGRKVGGAWQFSQSVVTVGSPLILPAPKDEWVEWVVTRKGMA